MLKKLGEEKNMNLILDNVYMYLINKHFFWMKYIWIAFINHAFDVRNKTSK